MLEWHHQKPPAAAVVVGLKGKRKPTEKCYAGTIKALFHNRERKSFLLIPTILPVIFSSPHVLLGSETANQCPGELFMPALSLIHLYYSDGQLQSSNGWTHRVLKDSGGRRCTGGRTSASLNKRQRLVKKMWKSNWTCK